MGSKVIVMLCLFLAMVVLISTQVSAETSNTAVASTEQVVDARSGSGPRGPGSHAEGVVDARRSPGHGGGGSIDGGDDYGVHGGGDSRGGGCRHGQCCGPRGCKKCCI